MKELLLKYRKHHIWLAAALVPLVLFGIFRGNQALMTWLVDHVTQPFKQALGAVTYLFPFPLAELLYIGAGVWACVYLVRSALLIRRCRGQRKTMAYRRLLGLLCAVVTVVDWFCLAWGINYCADGFQERSGITAEAVTVEELYRVTEYFTEQVNAASQEVPRNENGLFSAGRDEIFAASTEIYENSYDEFPFLRQTDREPKRMIFSKLLSAMGFTGYYAGFTGESVLNVDSPTCLLPATITHELAHQRGIASEQECNFLAVVVSTASDNPLYIYSGYLMGYIHLSNALYRADRELWQTLRQELAPEVLLDIQYNNAYWDQWESPVDAVSQTVYDAFLKGNGQSAGIQSYGTVVDLLVAYY